MNQQVDVMRMPHFLVLVLRIASLLLCSKIPVLQIKAQGLHEIIPKRVFFKKKMSFIIPADWNQQARQTERKGKGREDHATNANKVLRGYSPEPNKNGFVNEGMSMALSKN